MFISSLGNVLLKSVLNSKAYDANSDIKSYIRSEIETKLRSISCIVATKVLWSVSNDYRHEMLQFFFSIFYSVKSMMVSIENYLISLSFLISSKKNHSNITSMDVNMFSFNNERVHRLQRKLKLNEHIETDKVR